MSIKVALLSSDSEPEIPSIHKWKPRTIEVEGLKIPFDRFSKVSDYSPSPTDTHNQGKRFSYSHTAPPPTTTPIVRRPESSSDADNDKETKVYDPVYDDYFVVRKSSHRTENNESKSRWKRLGDCLAGCTFLSVAIGAYILVAVILIGPLVLSILFKAAKQYPSPFPAFFSSKGADIASSLILPVYGAIVWAILATACTAVCRACAQGCLCR